MAERVVCVATKPVAPILDVDWLTGSVRCDARHLVRTAADEAALGAGLTLGRSLGADVVVVAVAGPGAEPLLREAVAQGATRAIRIVVGDEDTDGDVTGQWSSEVIADVLSDVVGHAAVIVCGAASGDRGSGTVPSRLAHRLARPQALGLRSLEVVGGRLTGSRRLDAGRRELVALDPPCVVSLEGGAARVPRAALPAVVGNARTSDACTVLHVAVPSGARRGLPADATVTAYRARPSRLAAPHEHDPVRRAAEIVGTAPVREPPELLRCDPDAAADAILERLTRWGYR